MGLALFRPGQVKRRMTVMWLMSRSLLVLVVLLSGYPGLLLLVAVFWLLEGLSSPAYTAVVQRVYPAEARGRVMSDVRVAMALLMLALGPVAGWLLDSAGYRVLFPLAGLVGVASALVLSRLRVDETALEVRAAGTRGCSRQVTRRRERPCGVSAMVLVAATAGPPRTNEELTIRRLLSGEPPPWGLLLLPIPPGRGSKRNWLRARTSRAG